MRALLLALGDVRTVLEPVVEFVMQSPAARGVLFCSMLIALLYALFGAPEDERGTPKNLVVALVALAVVAYLARDLLRG